jgi:hypothetical protein
MPGKDDHLQLKAYPSMLLLCCKEKLVETLIR